MAAPYTPAQVMPPALAAVVNDLPYWFIIGGQAVRCFSPYRPSRDVDFGIDSPSSLNDLVAQLRRRGRVEILERSADTVHLKWNGLKVSVFVLAYLVPHVEARRLDVTGVLATKLHAILDRGLRRDFFDLYVMLQQHQQGICALLTAIRAIYGGQIDDTLMLRALTYFDDADREAHLPGEGPSDWKTVKDYLLVQVGTLLAPPTRRLRIQNQIVDAIASTGSAPSPRTKAPRRTSRSKPRP
jgi:hypothetical protein